MNTAQLFDLDRRSKAPVVFVVCLAVLLVVCLMKIYKMHL